MRQSVTTLMIIPLILAVVAGCIFFGAAAGAVDQQLGVTERLDAQVEARVTDAEAHKIEAEALRIEAVAKKADAEARQDEARVAQTYAEGDYLLHQAAAGAIESNTEIVHWYAVRGDVTRYVFGVVGATLLLVPVGIGLGVVMVRAYDDWQERKKGEINK